MQYTIQKDPNTRKKVLYMAYIWPESISSAAGLRSWNLLQSFLDRNWDVHCASASTQNYFSKLLQQHSIHTHSIQINSSSFDKWVKELQPDYVVFDRFIMEEQYGWRVEKSAPRAIRILDTQDLHFLRKAREKIFSKLKYTKLCSDTKINFQTEEAKREIASIYRSDISLLTSSTEKDLLIQEFHVCKNLLFYLPLLYNETHFLCTEPSFSEREHFCFLGNFQHKPNRDAVSYLKEKLWPKIREQMIDKELHIYGAYMDKAMKKLENQKVGLHLKGFTPDQFSTLKQYRLQLAPLRFGAGMKGKITDGWLVGTPSITTKIGAESIGTKENWEGFIGKNDKSFVELAIKAYNDENIWKSHQKKAKKKLKISHEYTNHSTQFVQKIESIKENIEEHRRKNFIGSILSHSKNHNKKYFSKWLEEKNKYKTLSNPNCHQ